VTVVLGWSPHFNNTQWSASIGSWDGSEWDSAGAYGEIQLDESGTWNVGYRPTKCRVTTYVASLLNYVDFAMKDKNGNWVASDQFNLAAGEHTYEFNMTFVGFDLDYLYIASNSPGSFSVRNIEFYG
jgi:hypothetical protein